MHPSDVRGGKTRVQCPTGYGFVGPSRGGDVGERMLQYLRFGGSGGVGLTSCISRAGDEGRCGDGIGGSGDGSVGIELEWRMRCEMGWWEDANRA